MKISQLWYALTILFFVGLANYVIWKRNGGDIKKHWIFIFSFTILATPFAYWDSFALKWGAYQYNNVHTLNLRIHGAELETYLFLSGISSAVVGATMVYARREEKGKKLSSRHHRVVRTRRQRNSGLQRLVPTAARARR